LQLAVIRVDGKNNYIFPFLLEKGKYTATITRPAANEDGAKAKNSFLVANIGGESEQRIYNYFNLIRQEANIKQQELQSAYFSAEEPARKDSIHQLFMDYQKTVEERELALVKANPDAYATAFHLYNNVIQGLGIEAMKEKYDLLGEKGKASRYGKKIEEQIQLLENVAVGRIAPGFKLAAPDGDSLSLHGVSAKVKIIDFWASWCGPCRAENPKVLEIYAEYQPKGLEIIGVSLDTDRDAWLKAIADDQLTWKQCFDPTGNIATRYGVAAIPHTFLLDENNKIIDKNLNSHSLKQRLSGLLD
jgi:thiol-disulfide isomerase/thioredoxin